MKRLVVFLALVSMAATIAFASGTAENKTAAGQKTTVTMIIDAVQQNHEALYQAWAQKYMDAHPNIIVKVTFGPKEVTDLLGLYLQYFAAKRSDLDIYAIDVVWPGVLADQLVNLDQYDAKAVQSLYFPSMWQNGIVKGRLVAVPFLANAPVLYYRTDLLAKYGLSGPPRTWNDLESMASKIQQGERTAGNQDFWGFVFQGKAYEGLTCDALEWISSFGGGTIVDANGNVTINNPNAIQALQFAANMVGNIAPPGVTGFDEEASRAVWQAGNAAFMRNWPYAYTLGNAADSPIKGKFDITTLPAGPSGKSAGTLGGLELAVSKYSKVPQAAADVAYYFAGKDFETALTTTTSEPTPVESVYTDPAVLKANPFFSKMKDVLLSAVPRPAAATGSKYNDVSRVFFTDVHNVLTKQMSAQSAAADMSAQLKDLLSQ